MLRGRTALVTGASRGIGAAIARRLAQSGARVALLARRAASLQGVADSIRGDTIVVSADITDSAQVEDAVATVCRAFNGVPDILVNNAGIFELAPLATMPRDVFTRTIETNLIGPFLLLRAILPGMRERGSGDVVTIGSVADRMVFPENGAYSPAKYGTRAMHEVLRAETRGTGVRAMLVSPGSVDTEMWEQILAGGDQGAERQLPSREVMLSAEDVAEAVCFAIQRPRAVTIDELRLSHS